MTIPTEPIGSIPRPPRLIEAIAAGDGNDPRLDALYDEAIRDTIARFEETGSPVITDGEQRKYHNFWTYCVQGMPNTHADGFKIPFSAGHTRRMPRLTAGPFRYKRRADSYLDVALRYAHVPVKQAVISPSALSLMYPADEIPGYSREQFLEAGGQDRPLGEPPSQLHRPEQPCSAPVLRPGPEPDRRAHLPRQRPRLHSQWGC
jgi:5-methyltetrahydropteroyltriglutamate--homocysteine methyltransferase